MRPGREEGEKASRGSVMKPAMILGKVGPPERLETGVDTRIQEIMHLALDSTTEGNKQVCQFFTLGPLTGGCIKAAT